MTEGTGFPFLDESLLHHCNQLAVLQDLLYDVGMRSPIVFPVREAAFSSHLSGSFGKYYKGSFGLWQAKKRDNFCGTYRGMIEKIKELLRKVFEKTL